MTDPTGFWRAFVASLLVLWGTCFASDSEAGYYVAALAAALLMALRYRSVFRPSALLHVTPPRHRRGSLRQQLRPQVHRAAVIWMFMAVVMIVPALVSLATGSTDILWRWGPIHLQGRSAILFGFACLFIAVRAGFGAYESLLTLRTFSLSEAQALTSRARYIAYVALALLAVVVLTWM